MMETKLKTLVLSLTSLELLADNCPSCFGPVVRGKRQDEPDYIVCLDGNFQHRRHKNASNEFNGRRTITPPLFMDPDLLKTWEEKYRNQGGNTSVVRVFSSFFNQNKMVQSSYLKFCLVGSLFTKIYCC